MPGLNHLCEDMKGKPYAIKLNKNGSSERIGGRDRAALQECIGDNKEG